ECVPLPLQLGEHDVLPVRWELAEPCAAERRETRRVRAAMVFVPVCERPLDVLDHPGLQCPRSSVVSRDQALGDGVENGPIALGPPESPRGGPTDGRIASGLACAWSERRPRLPCPTSAAARFDRGWVPLRDAGRASGHPA